MRFGNWVAQFGTKYQQYLDELGEMGENTAREMFATAPGDDGNTDVTVTRESAENGAFNIVASGSDAAFLEFGTGVDTMTMRPTVQAEFPIEMGSWSSEHEGPFFKSGFEYWYYNKVKYAGTPPTGAMQEACNTMEMWSNTIARRVFG